MHKKVIVILFVLFAIVAKAQCPQVLDYQNNLSSKPYWISCTGNNYTIQFQSPTAWGAYTIDWGDGSPIHSAASYVANSSIPHTYTATVDTFIVTLNIPSLSCTMIGVVVMEQAVNALAQIPIGGTSTVCAPGNLQFQNASTNVSKTTKFTWNFGDGSSSVFTFTNGGQTISHLYNTGSVNCQTLVTLQAQNYCSMGNPSTSTITPINVFGKDQASITPSSILKCIPNNTFTFNNTSTQNCSAQGNSFPRQEFWNFGNNWGKGVDSIYNWRSWPPSSPISISYPTAGTYTVMLRDSNACGVSQQVISVTLLNATSAGVAAPSGTLCQNSILTFTNTSTPGVFYQWNFGAGGGFVMGAIGTQTTSYSSPGTYTVKVVAFFPGGCSDTARTVVNISPAPTANFTHTPTIGCVSLNNVLFTDASVGAVSYNWAFGNGNTSTSAAPPLQNYLTIGNYVASLTVTAANTCVNTKTTAITVYQPPVAAFTPTSICLNSAVTFTDNSTSAATNTIVNWNWNFGDGSLNSVLQNPVHTYTAAGTYTVKLVVSSAFCKDSLSLPFTVNVLPTTSFTLSPVSGCSPLNVNFTNTSTGAITYLWNFGVTPTATSVATSPSFTYVNSTSSSITSTINLTATNVFGCTSQATRTLTVFPLPVSGFTTSTVSGCAPLAVTFTNSSTGATTYTWNFGDGNNSSLLNPSHTYTSVISSTQNFSVQLISENSNGCKDTAHQIISMFPKPSYTLSINPIIGCHPFTVNFPSISGASAYNWNFGDGGTSTLPSPVHTFTNSAPVNITYTTTLIAANSFGCSDTLNVFPTVYAKPVADFTFTPTSGCSPINVNFTNQSILNVANNWDFADGNLATGINTAHTFTTSATTGTVGYNVELLIFSADGCKDSVQKTVTLLAKPKAAFTVDTPACSPKVLSFTNLSQGGSSYNWNFGNSNTSSSFNVTQQYVNSTSSNQTYTVQLVVTNSVSCTDTLKVPVIIHPKPTFNIVASRDSGCANLSVNFNTSAAINYSWNFGDGGNANIQNPSHVFVNSASTNTLYTVQLIARDGYGCTDTSTRIIKVFPKPVALFVADPTTVFTNAGMVNFTNQSTGYVNSTWLYGDGNSSTDQNPSHQYSIAGEYTATLIVTSNKGCKDTFALSDIYVIDESTVQVPNAFTPSTEGSVNGVYDPKDLSNNVFYPLVRGVDKQRYQFSIYSRWGELLFETKDTSIGWDGYHKGKLCNQDVYIWKVSAITIDGKIIEKSGDVMLLR